MLCQQYYVGMLFCCSYDCEVLRRLSFFYIKNVYVHYAQNIPRFPFPFQAPFPECPIPHKRRHKMST